jgi:hypothetical protein
MGFFGDLLAPPVKKAETGKPERKEKEEKTPSTLVFTIDGGLLNGGFTCGGPKSQSSTRYLLVVLDRIPDVVSNNRVYEPIGIVYRMTEKTEPDLKGIDPSGKKEGAGDLPAA